LYYGRVLNSLFHNTKEKFGGKKNYFANEQGPFLNSMLAVWKNIKEGYLGLKNCEK
jgi:hypothetical protein